LRTGLARRFALISGIGLLAALLVAAAGAVLERQRFGASTEASFAKIETEVRLRFETSASTLAALSARVVAAKEEIAAASRDTAAARALFDRLDQAVPRDLASTTGVTVYDARLSPIAWAGRVFDRPQTRSGGPVRC
jgi:hypothetical protein